MTSTIPEAAAPGQRTVKHSAAPPGAKTFPKWQAGLVILLLLIIGLSSLVYSLTRKEVNLTADGKSRQVVTHSRYVSDVLRQVGVKVGKDDEVSPVITTRLMKDMKITVRRAIMVSIKADGTVHSLHTAKQTVGEVLQAGRISLDVDDLVTPDRQTPVTPGLSIVVRRVQIKMVTENLPVSYSVMRRGDANLEKGKAKIVRAGAAGVKTRTLRIVLQDGKLVKREVVGEKITKDPVPELIAIGTRKTVRMLRTSRGTYRYNEVRTMHATGYDPGPLSNGRYWTGRTTLGLKAGHGIVAVDPRVIPLRSRLYIPGYGDALAADTGGAIKGNRIDLGFDTWAEAAAFGRQAITVYILE